MTGSDNGLSGRSTLQLTTGSMETAKDILRKYDVIMIGENPKSEAAIKEIADKAWEAAQKRGDEECAVALGYSNAVQNLKSPDKETFMKSLFP